jgi:hypothetical protein
MHSFDEVALANAAVRRAVIERGDPLRPGELAIVRLCPEHGFAVDILTPMAMLGHKTLNAWGGLGQPL